MEKPHLIYALPRSRGTAILQASKKLKKSSEPNNPYNLYPNQKFSFFKQNPNWKDELEIIEKWNSIVANLDNKNTAVKILPSHFTLFPLSVKWYDKVQEQKTYEIFVVHRDLKELCYSFILAGTFGWFKHEEKQVDGDVEITESAIDGLKINFDAYLKYFPTNAELISWEKLPEDSFDKNSVTIEEQYSIRNFERVKNKDFCIEQIENLLKFYTPLIEEKISTLKWAN